MKQEFPQHFYNPLRRKIAADIVQKELIKLLPSVPQEQWPKIHIDIENWFEGSKSELASVQDFWDGFEGITQGFKLKNLLPFLTAENVVWETKEVAVDKLIFIADLPVYNDIFKVPFKSKKLIDYLSSPDYRLELENFKKDSKRHVASSLPRDSYPIVVMEEEGFYKILDGHRRAIRAILFKKESIGAYTGSFKNGETQPKNFWLSIGFLRNLVRILNLNSDDREIFNATLLLLKKLLKDNQNIIPVFNYRILESNNFKPEVRAKIKKEIGRI